MGYRVLLLFVVVIGIGCGQAEQGTVTSVDPPLPRIELGTQDWSTPLTEPELTAFLSIVEHLPNREVPDFTSRSVNLQGAEQLKADELVEQIRAQYRNALDMQALGETWCRDPKLAERFEKMGVNPELFAALATRVSLAWAASSIRHEIPILTTERKLGERLAHLKRRHDYPEEGSTESQRQLLVDEIEQTVALVEFLLLLKTVPQESIDQVRLMSHQLNSYLPKSNATAQFESVTESSPAIQRVGHTEE